MLEEPDVIDSIIEMDGKPVLVVSDAAITESKEERRKLLDAKLRYYAGGLLSGQIDVVPDPKQAEILVVCADDPDKVYPGIDSLRIKSQDGEAFSVPIKFKHLANPFA
jgi:hypothetical protein